MATIDYKEKYEQAMERARQFFEKPYLEDSAGIVEFIFPEFAESEDEKMRAMAIKAVYAPDAQSCIKSWGINPDDVIAWLEKQGKSSSTIHYWTEEEIEPIISDYLRGTEHYGGMIGRLRCLKPKSLEKQDEQKPDVDQHSLPVSDDSSLPTFDESIYHPCTEEEDDWSEENEDVINLILSICNDFKNSFSGHVSAAVEDDIKKIENWLKSLRPQSQWKPTDEQMEYLAKAIATLGDEGNCKTASILNDLRVDLKKLRE